MNKESEFTIVGGGVAGLAAAIILQNLNRDFILFEQAKELKGIGAGFGLAANAMQALDYIGIREQVEKLGFYLDSFAILDAKGKILANPNTASISQQYRQKNFAIHRADLHLELLSLVDPSRIMLDSKAEKITQNDAGVTLHFADGSSHRSKYLLVADGIKSPLRQSLLPEATPRYSGYTCWRASIDNSEINLEKGSETWGSHGRFGMTPLKGNRIYWYACVNGPANHPVFKNFKVLDLQERFKNYHHPIPAILAASLDSELIWSDINDLKPLNHLAYGNVLLIGDAGHGCKPNMGQGACMALEDVAVLQDELEKEKNVVDAFKNFEKRRLNRTKYIIENSKMIGDIAQWENKSLIWMRNQLMRITPARIQQQSLMKLFKEDFMRI